MSTDTRATPEATGTPTSVVIYGSCVSRDSFEVFDRESFQLRDYIARQSLLSAGVDARGLVPAQYETSSAFQRRNIDADVEGTLHERLRRIASATDVLLWDLTDERHGVYRFETGEVITRSIDVLGVPALAEAMDGAQHLPLGSDAHFEMWSARAAAFSEQLGQLGLRERTLVLALAWAKKDNRGRRVPSSMGISAEEANTLFARYYGVLELLGFEVLRIGADDVLADANHKWGAAPFHYTREVYERVREGVESFTNRTRD